MTHWFVLTIALFFGDTWPGFLGVGATRSESTRLPLEWSPKEHVVWTAAIPGHGQSTPVIWNGRIFVTAVDGPMKEKCQVFSYELATGNRIWEYTLASSDPVENSLYVSRAAPTPVIDAERLVVFFESGDIVSLDHNGKELWKRSLVADYGKFKNKFGLSGSPAQSKDSVFILVDDEGPSYLLCIDKRTGSVRWKRDRSSRASWSSPGLIQWKDAQHVVISSAGSIDGYDAVTGDLLWSYTDIGGNTGTTPTDLGEGRFFVAASAGRGGENTDMAKKSNGLMQITKGKEGWEVKKLWVTDEATPSWASPIAHQGCAYWVNNVGVVFCLDLATGKTNYKQRTKQSCWATPYAIGDRVYFFGKEGVTTVLASGPNLKSWPRMLFGIQML